jgi:hypothetical protein
MKHLLLALILLPACSFKKTPSGNQVSQGHEELYSEPKKVDTASLPPHIKRVVIAATNDLEGHYAPHEISFKDNHHQQSHKLAVGGVDIIASYFEILRKNYDGVLLVDSGNIFPKEPKEMKFVDDFYSQFHYDAITLGLQDFNLRLPKKSSSSTELFKNFAKKSPTPMLLSNLFELKTARPVEWPGTHPYLMKEINGVKIGIIGLIPDDIVALTSIDNRVGLFVENMLQSTLRNARLLRSLGADIIVVLTNQSLNCNERLAQEKKLPLSKVNFDPHHTKACEMNGPLADYLQHLPPFLIDVVIAGRSDQKTANYVNQTLVLSGFNQGKSFSFAELYVDTKTRNVLNSMTVIHQPVMFCREFFKESNDCYWEDPSVDHSPRVPATFLGSPIQPVESVKKKFSPYFDQPRKVSHIKLVPNVEAALLQHQADLVYFNNSLGTTQLVLTEVSGKELIKLLEEDFNRDHRQTWLPSPFVKQEDSLSLTVRGLNIELEASYKVLSDVESMLNHSRLKKFLQSAATRSLPHVTWTPQKVKADKVSARSAAPQR